MSTDAALGRALAMVRDLRARCPWDAAQTPQTLRPYLVEEVLELDQAIAREETAGLAEELGDVLLHLAFQIVIAQEAGRLDAEAVTRSLEDKMKRRHPHLFDLGAKPRSWEHGKRSAASASHGVLAGLPPTLPALLTAYRLQERAAGVGFDWPDAEGPLAKVREETEELERETRASGDVNPEAVQDEVGDLLFAVVNLARKLDLDAEHDLREATDRFGRRFAYMEETLEAAGRTVKSASPDEQNALWEEAKRAGVK